ncbi:DUF2147 domain-containing protein [Solitalea koreensis]|uniref:DUF2147 domain-containing protein n=1 Tax=Solitalea koreensis TaxID=543615 RepID=A0A521DRB2_9SPHI|nr:DUF2147 domain-containing protein [Solitalea koreensis]SMO73460.1 hypothetical protein SAMN06265350_10820 [Solitalea koreensis]
MKRIALILFVFLTYSLSTFAQTSADAIVGVWFNKDKDAKIQIYKKGNEFFGKIVWLLHPKDDEGQDKRDKENPDDQLKKRQIFGFEILHDFKYNADDKQWDSGKIYDPKSGKTYSCKISIKDKGSINVRGFVGISLIGRTDVWTRATI